MGAGSIFESGGRWRGVLYYYDQWGVRKRKYFSGPTRQAVSAKMEQFKVEGDKVTGTEMRVQEMCERAIERCIQRGGAGSTIRSYRYYLDMYIGPWIGRMKVASVTPFHVEDMIMQIDSPTGRARANCRAFLRMAFNKVAMKCGVVDRNPAALADPPKVVEKSREILTMEMWTDAIDRAPYREMGLLWMFVGAMGSRIDEASKLKWSDLVEKEDGWWMQLAKSKTPEGKRPVPVPKALMEKLLLFRDSSSDLVFPSQRGKPIDQSVMNKAWKKALEAAGHPYTNPYQMRKMFGTMHARKSTESVLQRLMRHRDVRTTKQFYVRVSDGDLRDAVD